MRASRPLAARDFPGPGGPLAPPAPRPRAADDGRIGALLDRVARALADPGYEDPHPVVARAAASLDRKRIARDSNRVSWDEGVALAHDLARCGLAFHPREDRAAVAYRDDNRYLWEFDEADALAHAAPWQDRQVRRRVSLMEFVNESDVEGAGDDAQEIWTLATELFPDDGEAAAGTSAKAGRRRPTPSATPSGTTSLQVERPDWCTVLESRATPGDAAAIDAIVAANKPLARTAAAPHRGPAARGRAAPAPPGGRRRPRPRGGRARGGRPAPGRDPRHARAPALGAARARPRDPVPPRPVAVDQRPRALPARPPCSTSPARPRRSSPTPWRSWATRSPSTASPPTAATRSATAGSRTSTRPTDRPRRRASPRMSGELSTRMGAAMRHAGSLLARRPEKEAPARGPHRRRALGRRRARPAVPARRREEGGRGRWRAPGVATYCISLDPAADDYVSRIFGASRYAVVDRVERLPERLPVLSWGCCAERPTDQRCLMTMINKRDCLL